MKYKRYTLAELAIIKYGKNQKKVQSDTGKIPVLGTGGLMGYATTFLYDKPSVLIGRKGTIGKVKYVEQPFWTVDTLFYTIVNTKLVKPKYLYYVMSLIDLNNYNEGTTIPSLRTETLNRLEFDIPSLEDQEKILSFLIPIDEKIDINNKINNNLEQQLRALYKSWFIDLNVFDNLTINQWKKGKLKDVLQLKRNSIRAGVNKELPYLPIDVIPMNTFSLSEFKSNEEAKSSLITFEKDDIIIGAMRVYFHRVIIAPCAGITRTTCFTLKPYSEEYLSYALLCCDQDSTIAYANTTSKGSTMPYAIWDGGLGDMEILIPPLDIAKKFNDIALPMIRKIQNSYFENNNLKNIRDSLLPKLMSGELDVSDIDI